MTPSDRFVRQRKRRLRIAALALLTLGAAILPARAGDGPLEGEWGGLDPSGRTAQVMVMSDGVLSFYWHNDYIEAGRSKFSTGGSQLEFGYAGGAATLVKTPSGARLTVRDEGRPPVSFDLKKD